MQISELIRNRVLDGPVNLFDTAGNQMDSERVKSDFLALRSYFALHGKSGVGIKLKKNPHYLLSMLACMDAGVPYVPMRDNYPQNRIDQIQNQTSFSFLLDEEVLDKVLQTKPSEFKNRDHGKENTLYTICTSGSTGAPKAVVVARRSITDFWKWCDDHFSEINEKDQLLQVADFTFDISLIDVALFLYKGVSVHFSNFTGNIFTLAHELESKKINFANTVVNNFNMLLEDVVASRCDLSSLKSVVMGGARFTTGLYDKCEKHMQHVRVNNLYGVTEVPVYSHAKTMQFDGTDIIDCTVSVGKPLGSCTAIIVDDELKIRPAGEKGEVLLGGGQLMKEYAKEPEKTAGVFIEVEGKKYYRTGDIGYQSESGDFFITGRMDDTIKYRGYRINLTDVDSYIQTLSYVENAVTVAVENELTQHTTICYLQLKEDKALGDIKKDMMEILLEYQIPEKIISVDSYPTNDNGKICKKTLRQQYKETKK